MLKTFSKEYQQCQMDLHKDPLYGVASVIFAPTVSGILADFDCRSLMDYGAGKRRLEDSLRDLGNHNLEYFAFDPAFPEYGDPRPADLVCCIDVLEHVEPAFLDAMIRELRKVTVKYGFFTVHFGPADKILPDGRNAHLTQQPVDWWSKRLKKDFLVHQVQIHNLYGRGAWFFVKKKVT